MGKYIPKVAKEHLIAIAGLVWLAAGINIIRLGTPDMLHTWQYPLVDMLTALVVFTLFFQGIFHKLVNKHSTRIMRSETEKMMILHFFDKKSYLMMAGMMTFGILLRKSHLLPPPFLGSFYTGLGSALAGAGIFFLVRYVQTLHEQKTAGGTL